MAKETYEIPAQRQSQESILAECEEAVKNGQYAHDVQQREPYVITSHLVKIVNYFGGRR